MAVELVTGYAGKAHVSSGEDGARQAGTVGTGMYALMTVDEPLKAVLENANTVTVGPGDVLINGRHVQLTGSTTFSVPVGAQGMRTSNLLVLRYELAEDETESVTAITLTGEPSASDPDDPELATGSVLDGDSPVDMPLYRVVTTGIESAQPVRLFETVPPIAGLTLGGLPGSLTSDQLPVVPISKGGTGATSAASARAALGLGALATLGSPLPVANGGTGATTADAAHNSLGLNGQTGYLKAGRGNVSDLSRDTLYNLAPGTYLVQNTATNGPESGGYGNLLVSYCSGNRIVGLLAYDNGHVYTTYGASSSGNFNWYRINTLSSGYDVLWQGSASIGATITTADSSPYEMFLVVISSGTACLGIKDSAGTGIDFFATINSSGSVSTPFWVASGSLSVLGDTSMRLDSCATMRISITHTGDTSSNTQITKIMGVM